MPEQIDLPTAYGPQTTRWVVEEIALHLRRNDADLTHDPAQSYIFVRVKGDNGMVKEHRWEGELAANLIIALNKANLSAGNTLQRRVLARLIADGIIEGTISGSPE